MSNFRHSVSGREQKCFHSAALTLPDVMVLGQCRCGSDRDNPAGEHLSDQLSSELEVAVSAAWLAYLETHYDLQGF